MHRPLLLAFLLATTGAAHAANELLPQAVQAPPQAAGLYEQRCASCHDHPQDRTPPRAMMIEMSPERVLRAVTTGPMVPQAEGLGEEDRKALAIYVTGKNFSNVRDPDPDANRCTGPAPEIRVGATQSNEGEWNGWGRDEANSRFQPKPGFTAAEIPRLKVKWAFAYPGNMAFAQPVLAGGTLYMGTVIGRFFALDAKTGCTRWHYQAPAAVKAAAMVAPGPGGKAAVFFGDEKANVTALDAASGRMLWQVSIDDHPLRRITGSLRVHDGVVYVPVTATEELASLTPGYTCCTSRGSVVALDAKTGRQLWKTHIIADAPKPFAKDSSGKEVWGPSGGGVWSALTVDAKAGLLYFGTGNSFTAAPTSTTDAVMALDLKTGQPRWHYQGLAADDFVAGCGGAPKGRCADPVGPDYDFGTPILHRGATGHAILLAGSKSGILYGIDPAKPDPVLWHTKVGEGSSIGGIIYGSASDGAQVYTSVAGPTAQPPATPGGVSAVDIKSGRLVWQAPSVEPVCAWGKVNCLRTQGAAITAIPGAIFAGSNDGHLRAHAAKDGKVIWDFDTAAKPYPAVNGGEAGIVAIGGSVNGSPQIVADGTLFLNSGYGYGTQPGNALLAFTVDGK